MTRRPVYTPPPKPPLKPLVNRIFRAHLSVTCYLDLEVWAVDESDARLAAHNMACIGEPSVAARMLSESKAMLCRRCAGNGFRLGGDWNVDTVEEAGK